MSGETRRLHRCLRTGGTAVGTPPGDGRSSRTETLAELTADVLGGPSGLTAVQILSELRSVLERDQIGLPTG
ncbi:hypothetical protein M8I34_27220 [Streptomyces sp. MCA2]|uniref:hypothetical protein n=1 Tax=Streptomyces sp. MCA2 TaxID=2944805 RepID=UPI0020229449|nr:hypothetical protein [Streptomyces sp. MCA2]MCL7495063.1 hypothetical protein [Streptomyces sp. MCA2]